MNVADAIAAVVTRVDTVAEAGAVYNRRRLILDNASYVSVMAGPGGKQAAAFVSLASIRPRGTETGAIGQRTGRVVNYGMLVELYRGVEDTIATPSEVTFRTAVEDVLRSFSNASGLIYSASAGQEIEGVEIAYSMLAGSFLCHAASIRLTIFGRAAF